MDGYLNNKNRVLNEWYQLFIQKRHILSSQDYKYWEHIKTLDLPHPNNDNWKYTSLKNFLEHNFISTKNITLNASKYKKLTLPIESYRLVFINGQFSKILSDSSIDPWVIKIYNTSNRYIISDPIQPDVFSYLTECLSDETIHLKLPKGKKTKKPLYLLYIDEGSNIKNQLLTSHYHHYFEIEHDTDTAIIEHFVSTNNINGHFSGARTSTIVGDRSNLHHIRLIFENRLSYHTSHHDINIGRSTHVNSNTFIILGPKFTYHKTNAKLNHEKSSLSLNSLMLLGNTDIGDIRTYLEHNNQNYALSRQLHKIIACNYSTGIFNGLIKVNAGSVKTDGKMINNNLLLHKNATINSIPKLEIYSDNVQCTHGSTIGQINNDHLFYLITRGIPEEDAFKILIYAFAMEVTEFIQDALLKDIILAKINQTLTRSLYENLSNKKN